MEDPIAEGGGGGAGGGGGGAGVGGFGCFPFGQGQPSPDIIIVPQTSLSAIFLDISGKCSTMRYKERKSSADKKNMQTKNNNVHDINVKNGVLETHLLHTHRNQRQANIFSLRWYHTQDLQTDGFP